MLRSRSSGEAMPVQDGKTGVRKDWDPKFTILDWHRQKLHLAENAEPEEQSAA